MKLLLDYLLVSSGVNEKTDIDATEKCFELLN